MTILCGFAGACSARNKKNTSWLRDWIIIGTMAEKNWGK